MDDPPLHTRRFAMVEGAASKLAIAALSDIRSETLGGNTSARYASREIVLAGSAPAGSDVLTVALEVHNDANLTTLFRHDLLNDGSYPMAVVAHLDVVRCGSEQDREVLGQPIIAARPDFDGRTLHHSKQDKESV